MGVIVQDYLLFPVTQTATLPGPFGREASCRGQSQGGRTLPGQLLAAPPPSQVSPSVGPGSRRASEAGTLLLGASC